MVIYRPHRGGLKESLDESVEFLSFDKMKEYIVNNSIYYIEKDDIEISSMRFNDVRTGWENTRYVCINKMDGKKLLDPLCIGMCATKYVRPSNNYYKTKVHKYLLKIAEAIDRSSINNEHKSFVYVSLGNRYNRELPNNIYSNFEIRKYSDICDIENIEVVIDIVTRLYPYLVSSNFSITNRISQSNIKRVLLNNDDLDMLFYDKCLNIVKSCSKTVKLSSKDYYETPVHKYLIRLSKVLSEMNIGGLAELYYTLISNRYNNKTPEKLYRLLGIRYYYQLNTLDDRKLRSSVSIILQSIKSDTVNKYRGKSIINKTIIKTLEKYDDIDMLYYSYSRLQWRNY